MRRSVSRTLINTYELNTFIPVDALQIALCKSVLEFKKIFVYVNENEYQDNPLQYCPVSIHVTVNTLKDHDNENIRKDARKEIKIPFNEAFYAIIAKGKTVFDEKERCRTCQYRLKTKAGKRRKTDERAETDRKSKRRNTRKNQ